MQPKKKRYLFLFAIIAIFSFSLTCQAEENNIESDSQFINGESMPYAEVWTLINTTSGTVFVPAGTYVPGASAYYVRLLQATLNTVGYNCGTADGIYGTNTRNAIINLQRDFGLSVDGVAGENTWRTASDLVYALHTSVPW